MTNEPTAVLEESLEDVFQEDMLGGAFDAGGVDADAQLLEIASEHTLQLNGEQIKAILYIDHIFSSGEIMWREEPEKLAAWGLQKQIWEKMKKDYIKYTRFNDSKNFMAALVESVAYRKLLNENTLKVNIGKNT